LSRNWVERGSKKMHQGDADAGADESADNDRADIGDALGRGSGGAK